MYQKADPSHFLIPSEGITEMKTVGYKFPFNYFLHQKFIQADVTDRKKIETRTCSDVKATSLGIAAIPFSLTSGNILKRAINIAYMLDMAPPGVHSNILLLFYAS